MARIRTRTGGRIKASGNKSQLRLEGADLVQKAFSKLYDSPEFKNILPTLKKAAKPLVDEAKMLVPVDDGELKKSIGAIDGRGEGKGRQIYVGPRRGKGPNGKGYHGHLVEYGSPMRKIREVKKGNERMLGKNIGPMPAQPFLRPAWDRTHVQVQKNIFDAFTEILNRNT